MANPSLVCMKIHQISPILKKGSVNNLQFATPRSKNLTCLRLQGKHIYLLRLQAKHIYLPQITDKAHIPASDYRLTTLTCLGSRKMVRIRATVTARAKTIDEIMITLSPWFCGPCLSRKIHHTIDSMTVTKKCFMVFI